MITRIREVRLARDLTLQQVAERCLPPTTPQTIGRLETGARTVSVGWLNRIAAALNVQAADLVRLPDQEVIELTATLDVEGAHAAGRQAALLPPRAEPGLIAVTVVGGIGDYRGGDEIWLDRMEPADFGRALNRDILLPRPGGRFLFGRLINRDAGRLHILPPGPGRRQVVVADPEWLAVAVRLIRPL